VKYEDFEDSFSKTKVHFLKPDPDPYSDYNSDSAFRTLAQTFNFKNEKQHLFARGRLERYKELKDGMFEGGVRTQDERQVSW
jgi:hypothetical protein